jgi:hypothetical protein
MPRTRQEILDNRRRLKSEYGKLFDSAAVLLFRLDPKGINFEENTDEYEAEVETILPRLRDCHSDDDVLQVVQRSLFAGLIWPLPVHGTVTRKSPLKFGDCGKHIETNPTLCRRSFEKETTTLKIAGIITSYLTLRYVVVSGFLSDPEH